MRHISLTSAIIRLNAIRNEFRERISVYEDRADSCETCSTPGACCLDAHFVNVRITRLEAVAIKNEIDNLPDLLRTRVSDRIDESIAKYKLDEAIDSAMATYACPLFERGIGCLVHSTAKPLPCIAHACYRNENDLPPDNLLDGAEAEVLRLNALTYALPVTLESIPIAIR